MILDFIKLKEVKPALAGYIRDAQLLLRQDAVPNDKAVHDVRVLMKKSRAVLQLIRSQIDDESYKREYQALREIGRLMSSWRETSVHRKILKNLRKNHDSVFSDLKDFDPVNQVAKKPTPGEEDIEKVKEQAEKIVELLGKSGYRIRFLSLNNLDPVILMKDLEQAYNSVIHCYLKSRNNISPDNLHEFRKKSKSFLYQLWFFRPLKPGAIKGLEKKIDIMTQNLGKYNDLAVLIETLGYKYSQSTNQPALDELVVLIRDQQDAYLSKVWPTAYEIFCPGQKLVNILGFKLLLF